MLLQGGVPDGGLDRNNHVLVLLREGFTLPVGGFFRRLLQFYGLEVTHLKLNSIAQIVIFIHLYEGYLGIAPHFNLWRALYCLKGHLSNVQQNMVGGAAFSLCHGTVYPNFELRDTNKDFAKDWFLVSNLTPNLPARLGGVPEYKAC